MIDTMTIHIFLEVGLHDTRKLEFASDEVSGLEIKEKGGVPLDDDLALRHGEQLELVKNDQVITIKNGEHFVALPPGSVS